VEQSIPWLKFSSPRNFYMLAGTLIPWFAALATLLLVVGLYIGFFVAPTDYQQGESYRIIFIHVPAAWMSMFLYVLMAVYSAIGLTWNVKMADMMSAAIAPTGAWFAFLALWTGALWGKPTWGTYWVWDARLTSELLLLFLYLGVIALRGAIDDPQRAARASGLLALVGVVNVPIIYFSVRWWNTLHQGASVSVTSGTSMEETMFTAMMVMTFACWMYAIAIVLSRARAEILERERYSSWVAQLVGGGR
jgi:heme exporter protein C